MNSIVWLLILLCMVLNTAAQLLLKMAMNRIGTFDFTLSNIVPIGLKVILSPFIMSGLFLYVLSVIVWLMVLSRSEVTLAYPMTSIAFILTALVAFLFLGEHLTFFRLAGIILIIVGIFLMHKPI